MKYELEILDKEVKMTNTTVALDIEKEVEPIRSRLFSILKDFEKLIDKGCIDNCSECFLNEIIIPDSKEGYSYASGSLFGPLTICDFLGILQDEL